MLVIEDLEPEKTNRANEIISLFSQHFFYYFNDINKNQLIFWHGKCFSINKEKINSYLKYRSGSIKNVMTTYFLKAKKSEFKNANLQNKENECKKFSDYETLKQVQNGILYYDGNKINLEEFYNGNIKIEDQITEEKFLSLSDFE